MLSKYSLVVRKKLDWRQLKQNKRITTSENLSAQAEPAGPQEGITGGRGEEPARAPSSPLSSALCRLCPQVHDVIIQPLLTLRRAGYSLCLQIHCPAFSICSMARRLGFINCISPASGLAAGWDQPMGGTGRGGRTGGSCLLAWASSLASQLALGWQELSSG